MSQTKEVRYTARSLTPPPSKDRSRSRSRSPVRSKSPVKSNSRSPVKSGTPPPPKDRSRSRSRSEDERNPKRRSRSRSRSRSPRSRSPRSRSPRSRSRSPRKPRERSRSRSEESRNPGNNLYVTGLSLRTTSNELEKLFSREGKVQECQIVLDPRTKDSRGFAFVTMSSVDEAERCIKYLNRTVLDGKRLVIEKAKRIRQRTPTPGKYCGAAKLAEMRRRPHGRSPPRHGRSPPRYGRSPPRYGRREMPPRSRDWDRRGRDFDRRPRDNGYRR